MKTRDQLLSLLLKSNDYVSGEAIASILGISRNAVWKATNSLSESGIKIDTKPNKGYKLAENINFVNKVVIDEYLNDDFYDVEVVDSLPSTSTYLKENQSSFKEGKVVFARMQTEGRGRLNRTFYSPKDKGLYFSVLVRPKTNIASSIYLTVLSAVSVFDAVYEQLGIKLAIKWVNDLYKDNHKVVGILSEGSINIDYKCLEYCVIGIGINVLKPDNGYDEEIKSIATSLLDTASFDLNKLASLVLKKFKKYYLEYLNGNYEFIDTYINNQLLTGMLVKAINLYNGEEEIVEVIKVNKDCSLQVKTLDGSIKDLNSGEVRLIINNENV